MNFSLSSQLLLDDDVDDADDFDLDFDEDFEYLSDEEFEVIIDYDEYGFDDSGVLGNELCLDDADEALDDFDSFDDVLADKDYADGE